MADKILIDADITGVSQETQENIQELQDSVNTVSSVVNEAISFGQLKAAKTLTNVSLLNVYDHGNYIFYNDGNITGLPPTWNSGGVGAMIICSDDSNGSRILVERQSGRMFVSIAHKTLPQTWTEVTNQVPPSVISAVSNGQIGDAVTIENVSLFSIVQPGSYSWTSSSNISDQPSGSITGYGTMTVVSDAAGYGYRLCYDRLTKKLHTSTVHPSEVPVWAELGGNSSISGNTFVPDWTAPIRFQMVDPIPTLNSRHYIFTEDMFVNVRQGLRIDWIRVDTIVHIGEGITSKIYPDIILVNKGQHATIDPDTFTGSGQVPSETFTVDCYPPKLVNITV